MIGPLRLYSAEVTPLPPPPWVQDTGPYEAQMAAWAEREAKRERSLNCIAISQMVALIASVGFMIFAIAAFG